MKRLFTHTFKHSFKRAFACVSTCAFISMGMLLTKQPLYSEYPHVVAAMQLIAFESEIIKKLDFKVFSVGGRFYEKINKLSLTIEVPKSFVPLDPEFSIDPRRLIVVMLKQYMDLTNSQEKIKPFLKNYPFTPENFDYRIILPDYDTLSSKEHPKIALVYTQGDNIIYCYRDETTKKLEPIASESYNNALKYVVGNMIEESRGS